MAEPIPFELDALTRAERYQRWIHDGIAGHLGRRIAEFGAGIGGMSRWLPVRERLVLTEKDPSLFPRLEAAITETFEGNDRVSCRNLGVDDAFVQMAVHERIDTFVSFNVMEHIEDDAEVFGLLFDVLRKNQSNPGRLIAFVPAHSWAFGEIDRTFGHFRRYDHVQLGRLWRELAPDFEITHRYFNLPGLAAWIFLGRVLKRKTFGLSSVNNFERILPWVRPVDDWLHGPLRLPFGQSLLMVAKSRTRERAN